MQTDSLVVKLLVAHEGISRGKIITDDGHWYVVPKFWGCTQIQELVKKFNSVPIYRTHESVSWSPRVKIGEVIESWTEEFNNRLNALVLARIWNPVACDSIRNKRLDTCSLEAEVEFKKKKDLWLVDKIEEVIGLALGSRETTKPGFSDARVIAFWELGKVLPKSEV